MLRSSQIVFLIDVSAPLSHFKELRQVESYENSIKLSCLRLLTELGGLCVNGAEGIRWAYKFYDSLLFKPGITQKIFLDFNFSSFEKFGEDLRQKYASKRINFNNDDTETSPISRGHTHAYILNKAIQEILLDYDWDRPDISSPVKCEQRKNGVARITRSKFKNIDESGPLNIVVTFNDMPKCGEDMITFCKTDGKKVNDLLLSLLDKSTQLGLKDKKIRLHLVNTGLTFIGKDFHNRLSAALLPINGNIHELNNLVSLFPSSKICNNKEKNSEGSLFNRVVCAKYNYTHFGISNLFLKMSQRQVSRNRISQKGPILLWEDENGLFFMNLQIYVLSIKGSSTQEWQSLTVCGVIKAEMMSLLGIAMPNSNMFICHSKDASFKVILDILYAQQLVLILQHKCGGLAALSPWMGGTGYLVLFSASGLVTPPIHINDKLVRANCLDETHSKVISNLIKKTLKVTPAVPCSASVPECQQIVHNHFKQWFPTGDANSNVVKPVSCKLNNRRKMMMERLQKKYRPEIPKALSGSSLPPQVLVDVTQPTSAAAIPEGAINTSSRNRASRIVTRGQQIAKRGQMIKAQKKAKQLEDEAAELMIANKKKVKVAEKRSKLLSCLTAKIMDVIGSSTENKVVLDNLKIVRDEPNYCADSIDVDESDYLLILVQAIVSISLNVIKLTCPKFLLNSQLKETLSDGIFLNSGEVKCSYEGKQQVRQLKLQSLLHLEVLWMSGYADCHGEESDASKEKDWHVEEIIKHLRVISLHHDTNTMSTFLEKTVLPNYEGNMGEILVEIYDELNQPLANSIKCYSHEDPSPRPVSPPVLEKQPNSAPVENSPKRPRGRIPLKRQASQRQIVVNVRKKSAIRLSTDRTTPSKLKNVKRSLFDKGIKSNSIDPTTKSLLKTPNKVDILPVFKTPNGKLKSAKRNLLLSPIDDDSKNCDSSTSESKRRRIYAPETPVKHVGRNIFNANRLHKSTGETSITESPEVKKSHRTAGNENDYRSYALKKSFYARNLSSRNFEWGKKKDVSPISGLPRRFSMPSALTNHEHIFSNYLRSIGPDDKKLSTPTKNNIKLTFS